MVRVGTDRSVVARPVEGFGEIAGFGGLASILPVYTGVTGLAFFAAMGLPGLSAFISEVLVLLGAWQAYPALTVVAASAVILTAGYMLWALQRVYLGPPNEKYRMLPDMSGEVLSRMASGQGITKVHVSVGDDEKFAYNID